MTETELQQLAKQWQEIKNSDERESFYDREVFPAIKQVVVPRERNLHKETYTHLILPVGLSPEPLILSILILQPEEVYLLYTSASKKYLDRIVQEADLRFNQVEKDEIDDTNVPEIYQKVRAIYDKWGQPKKVAVDISGGKKSMVGGCALAGSLIGARLFYVDSNFDPVSRKPEPGTETLRILENPYDVIGDLKWERARELFTQLDFVGAQRLLEELKSETSTPTAYEAFALLCEAYSAWDDWKIELALKSMQSAVDTIERYARLNPATPLHHQLERLQKQAAILATLQQALRHLEDEKKSELEVLTNPVLYLSIAATLRAGAIRQEQRGKLDVAALLWYRLIEFFSQQRLSNYGLRTAEPDYANVDLDETELLEKYRAIKHQENRSKKRGKEIVSCLPKPISLLEGYRILKALEDDFAHDQNLQGLRGKVEARDRGIFAHGFKPLSQKSYNDFKALAEKLVVSFQAANGCDRNSCWEDCCFIAML